MRTISWILTIASAIALGACFADETWLVAAAPLSILAAWTDKIAIDQEMREFLNRNQKP